MTERNLDFDRIINRKNTDCLKYDFAVKRGMPADVLPLWVADMDFETSSYIEDALVERAKMGIYGYSDAQTPYFEAVAGWMKRHHNWEPKEEWLIKTPGVVCTCDGSQSLHRAWGCRADPVTGLLSIFGSHCG